MTCKQLSFLPEPKCEIIQGDCLEEMAKMQPNSIDFIVTDPPYGLKFMGKTWDHGIPGIPFWEQALRICKPGAMMAAFGGTRTHHRLMCAIEDAGWEIRDVIMWLYGSGFPKSHNHFGLEGYGTCLKPAWEPIILAMKPLDGTYAQNSEKWGVGGINIDKSRVPIIDTIGRAVVPSAFQDRKSGDKTGFFTGFGKPCISANGTLYKKNGRWPANFILDEAAAEQLDEMSGIAKSTDSPRNNHSSRNTCMSGSNMGHISYGHNDSGGASRFFYCAKASSSERNKGCELNNHPTVKPISLMKYIIKLLAPPGNPTCLDPFAGSGSTLLAAKELGIDCIGIEMQQEYCEIAKARIA